MAGRKRHRSVPRVLTSAASRAAFFFFFFSHGESVSAISHPDGSSQLQERTSQPRVDSCTEGTELGKGARVVF